MKLESCGRQDAKGSHVQKTADRNEERAVSRIENRTVEQAERSVGLSAIEGTNDDGAHHLASLRILDGRKDSQNNEERGEEGHLFVSHSFQ